MDEPSAELLERWRTGDEDAAAAISERYFARLVRLARSRLTARLARRLDAEDVALSACRSFFVGARSGRFSLRRDGDLWRLLATITLRKLYRQAALHTADRRAMRRELPDNSQHRMKRVLSDAGPTPDEAAALADEIASLLSGLDPLQRRIIELRLQGLLIEEIARSVARSERTVRRVLDSLKAEWTSRLTGESPREPTSRRATTRRRTRTRHRTSGTRGPQDTRGAATLRYSDYLLQKHLGSGGMGKVYRALEIASGRDVAVKFLKKSFLARRDAVERFLAEARCLTRLRHPGIVRVHGLGTTPAGGYFIAMDLVRGGDLAAKTQFGPLPVREAARLLAEAAEAVEFAHRQGVVHCDLKPANLLLSEQGRVVLTDFGLAQRIGCETAALAGPAGTAGFMAPEQIDSSLGPVGPHTDVYGLGAVLFALLTGRAPQRGATAGETLHRALAARQPPDPRDERAGVPDALAQICKVCLEPDSRVRYATAADVAAALRRFCQAR